MLFSKMLSCDDAFSGFFKAKVDLLLNMVLPSDVCLMADTRLRLLHQFRQIHICTLFARLNFSYAFYH